MKTFKFDKDSILIYKGYKLLQEAIKEKWDTLDSKYFKPDKELTRRAYRSLKGRKGTWLIDNILQEETILMISVAGGVGKSIFSMILGYALTCKGRLPFNWKVPNQCKVLHLYDSELNDIVKAKHEAKIKKLFKGSHKEVLDNFVSESVAKWNLNRDEDREKLHKLQDKATHKCGDKGRPVHVIIIDSLNTLATGAHLEKKLGKISRLF